jgi:prolyl-tRNA synthetase
MKFSQLFTKTTKSVSSDEVSKNAQLLIRAGYINKEMAGVYSYLPLGLRVVEKIKAIVKEEMDKIGGQEIIMTSMQRKELWEKTDRWDDEKVDVWFKSELHAGGEVGFAWSHEEPMCDMMRNFIKSYRDLPAYPYQFQTKLRNELRAKSGIMRGREFLMKDLYSFSVDEEQHEHFYQSVIKAYNTVFDRVGIGADTFVTFASGGAFTQFSHEFQTITENGEDIVYLNREKNIAINEEVYNDDTLESLKVSKNELEKVATSEVGNIFNFGTDKSSQLDLYFTDENGKRIPVWLGSYGIGITRLMGVITEKFADEDGIIWPLAVAPYHVHLVSVGTDQDIIQSADAAYQNLQSAGIEVFYDDRDESTGKKLADADLIGIPIRLVISKKTGDQVEWKLRTEKEPNLISLNEAKTKIQSMQNL